MSTERQQRIAELRAELFRLQAEEAREAVAATDGTLRAECLEMLHRELPVTAVKHYRNRTGCTLREAKAAIDAMRESN
jgi:ribosomal protein L7/L12